MFNFYLKKFSKVFGDGGSNNASFCSLSGFDATPHSIQMPDQANETRRERSILARHISNDTDSSRCLVLPLVGRCATAQKVH